MNTPTIDQMIKFLEQISKLNISQLCSMYENTKDNWERKTLFAAIGCRMRSR